jgi:hypothetical protein
MPMPQYDDSEYKIFQLEGAPPALFGETYAIAVGIHTAGQHFKGEYFVLSQRPTPRLELQQWRFSAPDVQSEFLTVNLAFMVEESLNLARTHLINRLFARATELKAEHVLGLQIDLKECAARPFVGCWLRNLFHDQLTQVAQKTECRSLGTYLLALRQLHAIEGL